MFARDSVIRRVNIEPAIGLGAGRALLLQLAHPIVAQGVQDHSEFKRNPFKRLQGTLEATYAVVFGSDELARGVGRRIQWVHEHVTGPGYRAGDPENLMWVHATLMDTALGCYTEFVGPLSDADAETYYREMMLVGEVFGLPLAAQPQSLAEFRAYFADTVAGLAVSDIGRDLGQFIVDPILPFRLDVITRPAIRVHRLLSVGRLPGDLRQQFHFTWTERDQTRLSRVTSLARTTFRALPKTVRTAGTRVSGRYLLAVAGRHVRQFEERTGRSELAA